MNVFVNSDTEHQTITLANFAKPYNSRSTLDHTLHTARMAFFQVYNNDRSFLPVFNLLSGLDQYSCEVQRPTRVHQRRHAPAFNPRFDVRETETGYELHGELPGVERDNIQIEFTDPQTLVVRGRVERSYTGGSGAEAQADDSKEQSAPAPIEPAPVEPTPAPSHKATVEDAVDEDASVEQSSEQATPATTPSTPVAEPVKPQEPQPQQPKAPADKYWFSERSVGQFSRTFKFASRVDQDGVAANLNNGILTVEVPKAKKYESRRIVVF